MRTLIYSAFVSLDGIVDSPGGGSPQESHRSSGWSITAVEEDADAYELKAREQEEAGAMMMGRVSYEGFSPVWPKMEEFARYNALPKYVVSKTLQQSDLVDDWGDITVLRSLDDVAASKAGEGGPIIIHGSATLGRNLADSGLIDRYHLLVFPLLLGAGKRMFSETDKNLQKLQLLESESYSNGIQKLVYAFVG
jgi:dihydrofolate reductase